MALHDDDRDPWVGDGSGCIPGCINPHVEHRRSECFSVEDCEPTAEVESDPLPDGMERCENCEGVFPRDGREPAGFCSDECFSGWIPF